MMNVFVLKVSTIQGVSKVSKFKCHWWKRIKRVCFITIIFQHIGYHDNHI